MTTVTVKLRSGSTASTRVPVCTIEASPAEAIARSNENTSFHCKVVGPEDQSHIYYVWRNTALRGWLKIPGQAVSLQTTPNATRKTDSPYLDWNRHEPCTGVEVNELVVEVCWRISGAQKDKALGTASAVIHVSEYRVSCPLVGKVTRTEDSHSCVYRCQVPRIEGAIAYWVQGRGFNHPPERCTDGRRACLAL